MLRDKFRDFARETGAIGQERVDNVNTIIERLIDAGHSEAATIAEWKDGLNDMWADLLELIDTRMQLLAASYDLHRYFYTGTEILGLIDEKHRELPEDVGLDASTAESFHRVHTAFERELHLLGVQVPSTHFPSATTFSRCWCWGPHLAPMGEPLEWTSDFSSLDSQWLRTERSSSRTLVSFRRGSSSCSFLACVQLIS